MYKELRILPFIYITIGSSSFTIFNNPCKICISTPIVILGSSHLKKSKLSASKTTLTRVFLSSVRRTILIPPVFLETGDFCFGDFCVFRVLPISLFFFGSFAFSTSSKSSSSEELSLSVSGAINTIQQSDITLLILSITCFKAPVCVVFISKILSSIFESFLIRLLLFFDDFFLLSLLSYSPSLSSFSLSSSLLLSSSFSSFSSFSSSFSSSLSSIFFDFLGFVCFLVII
ncbi:putative ORFan [Cotonvirus japonicus]|uniref:ORFan n=1 Tax=Cotonvirus japonicus TaxID=2811091 RepID=A0ABM7NSA5_9VIRU|nr:putative ORFan [Cotonvirus japonicus]BCS83042.1 putative ORFan [Cotonvirus japonicus]